MNERANDDQMRDETGGAPLDPEAAMEALRREAEDNWNKYLRAVAELDNFRKRSARDIDSARKAGAERLAKGLLPVRDSLEAALATADKADFKTLLEGQQATLRLLDEALAAADITVIDPHGEPFDPTKHEALSTVAAPHVEPNTVIDVIQKGYQMHDRLLRAAKVIVARSDA
ncbi:MAG TPA: nucleotide exchange factor GrpE [Gammaproteobacteria bacterium]|nr:nucleotide exchange factor GrpE [Gammaproteobacteria bacterium]